jgi:heme/copper-type cytochrome/quinol oxidase subunit 2
MRSHRAPVWILIAALVAAVASASVLVAQSKRDVSVIGRRYTYVVAGATGPEIRVKQGDLVTVTFTAEDIPHSFTISDDHYRIDRRGEPGKPVMFRFRADKVGEFEIRCTLTLDERCAKEMRGKLIVTAPAADQPRR